MSFPVTIVTPAEGPAGAQQPLELLEAALIRAGLELGRFGDDGRGTERLGTLAHVARSSSAVLYTLQLTVRRSHDRPEEPSDVAAVRAAAEFVQAVRAHNDRVPILLFGEQLTARRIPQSVLSRIDGVINAYEDTPDFLARKIQREVSHYLGQLAPPFFAALMRYANDGAYSWHCPGHSGGTAFLKSPIGTLFHGFFGENLLRADVCNAVEELGQLLDHSGPIADSERLAARTFRADHLYFVTNGTSTSNKIVWNSLVGPGDIVAVDRNCHKSVLHAIVLTGAVPIYLMPTRNRAEHHRAHPPQRIHRRRAPGQDRRQPAGHRQEQTDPPAGPDPVHLRRHHLPRRRAEEKPRRRRRRPPLRRGLAAARRLPQAVRGDARCRQRPRPHRPDRDLLHPVHPQAPRRPVPGVPDPRTGHHRWPLRQPGPGSGVPHAHLDQPAVRHHRQLRRLRRDDG
nr:hypothetical protein GCM10020092_058430 [Actinoplanes digitatis]